MNAIEKLIALRMLMKEHRLAAYIQPVHDEYMSEYPPPCHRRVEWLTGFSGSAGTGVVTADKAALFTDGRYTLQAANETDASLFEQHNIGDTMPEAWLASVLAAGARVGYDARLYTQDMLRRIQKPLARKHLELVPSPNLVDAVWAGRPPAPATPVFIHDIAHAGESSADKRRRMAESVTAAGAAVALLTTPESVNWLLNIRARDIEHTPLALCIALLHADAHLTCFIDPARCGQSVRAYLGSEVTVIPFSGLASALAALGNAKKPVLCDPQSTPVWFTQTLTEAGAAIVEAPDPCVLAKAVKNPVELQGIRQAHIRDGTAVVKLLCWLDGQRDVTEIAVSDRLLEYRAQHPMFVEPSFPTIAGSGPHGAIVHYRASHTSNRKLQAGELFLLDSGGQYPDGTTDITRTVPIGAPSAEHKDRFTRVLKGHIALALAQFPEGTAGSQLDALARQFLWQAGLDYDHGTGHGVGCFLGVHEGPQRIGKRGGDAALRPGMIVSNEPGYYKTGAYGIRIENLVAVVETGQSETGKKRLGFETVTCVPIDTRLIEVSLLTDQEKEWLNSYHAWVLAQMTGSLNTNAKRWLQGRCAAID